MNLVQQQLQSNENPKEFKKDQQTQCTFQRGKQIAQQNIVKPSFRQPFSNLYNRTRVIIKITLFRFMFVVLIYLKSDWFLVTGQNGMTQPWNAMIFFLAQVIEIIALIGDCVLIKFLKKQKLKLIQIQDKINQGIQPNIILKAAPYSYYLSDYQLVKCFKTTHKSYSSSYSIVKYMHIFCTFIMFGQMALRQQNNNATPLQYITLWLFLASIYYTSFESDWSTIQMSSGPNRQIRENSSHVQKISFQEIRNIESILKNEWRLRYAALISIGCILIIAKLVIDLQSSTILVFGCICLAFHLIGLALQKYIFSRLFSIIGSFRRQQINSYSIMSKLMRSTNNKQLYFKIFFSLQRFSILFLFFALSRQNQTWINFYISAGTILVFFYAQNYKFLKGDKIKLLRIKQSIFVLQNNGEKAQQQSQHHVQCAICIQNIRQNQAIKILPCSSQHKFHSQCLVSWLKQKSQCPLCRYELKQYI